MWLINTHTLTLAEHNEPTPPYAILSHTWKANQEVTFKEFLTPTETTKAKSGYKKIEACAMLAATDQLFYLWVDTCCIDKTSSAEISEAVNSMFTWYRNSSKCYAYMCDVRSGNCSNEQFQKDFKDSRWHTRGWTLQELIAPRDVEFYDRDWTDICSRNDNTELLSYITGVPENALDGGDLGIYSVAEKMSWAAKRLTTRPEDLAYCLLGLFDVSMPLLYGEGRQKAFRRLQQHIIEMIDDQTILAWDPPHLAGQLPIWSSLIPGP